MVTRDSGGLWEGDSVSKLEPGNLASGTSWRGCPLEGPVSAVDSPGGQTQCSPSLEGARKGPGEGGPWPMALGEAGGRAERSRILCESPLASPVVPAALLPQVDRRNCAWVLAVGRTPPVGQAGT